MSINGSDAICSGSSSYHVDGLPCNSTVVWAVSPLNVVASDANANSLTLTPTPTGNGIITVTATVSNVCGGNPIVISKPNIIVGSPTSIGIDVGAGSYSNMENCGDPTDFKVLYDAAYHNYSGKLYVTASNSTSLNWTEVSNSPIPYWAWSTSNNGQTLNVSQKYANKYLSLKVTAANACGSISKTYTFGSDVCPIIVESVESSDYMLSPNPAANDLSVSVNTADKTNKTVSFAQIRIYDGTGNLKKQIKYESGTRQAQITDLRPGYYYVEISNGKTSIRKPLVVQR